MPENELIRHELANLEVEIRRVATIVKTAKYHAGIGDIIMRYAADVISNTRQKQRPVKAVSGLTNDSQKVLAEGVLLLQSAKELLEMLFECTISRQITSFFADICRIETLMRLFESSDLVSWDGKPKERSFRPLALSPALIMTESFARSPTVIRHGIDVVKTLESVLTEAANDLFSNECTATLCVHLSKIRLCLPYLPVPQEDVGYMETTVKTVLRRCPKHTFNARRNAHLLKLRTSGSATNTALSLSSVRPADIEHKLNTPDLPSNTAAILRSSSTSALNRGGSHVDSDKVIHNGAPPSSSDAKPDADTNPRGLVEGSVSTWDVDYSDLSFDRHTIGRRAGQWVRVGRGAYADVLSAQYDSRNVAVKEWRVSSRNQKVAHDEFLRCMNLLVSICHPNVARIMGACTSMDDSGVPYLSIVMESVQSTLEDILFEEDTPIFLDKLKLIFTQTAAGMSYLHRFGYHGDLKPSNIGIVVTTNHSTSTEGRRPLSTVTAKVLDFGLLGMRDVISASLEPPLSCWSAPEVHRANCITGYVLASDVWSWAAIMLAGMTQKRPAMQRPSISKACFPERTCSGDAVHPVLSDLLSMCLADDAEARPLFSHCYSVLVTLSNREALAMSSLIRDSSERQQATMPLPDDSYISIDALREQSTWEVIGQGSFGSVYKTVFEPIHDHVAVKELKNTDKESAFHREIFNLHQLRVNQVLNFYGWTTDSEGRLYMVTEYCARGHLKQVLDEERAKIDSMTSMDWGVMCLDVGLTIAQSLAFIHSKKFVHLDVAARNVLVTAWGQYKLSDLGLMTRENGLASVICIPYSPPEALRAKPYNRVATVFHDIWAYGVLLYEVLNKGPAPFEDLRITCSSDQEWLKALVSAVLEGDKPPPPVSVAHDPLCREIYNRIILPCRSSAPTKRPQMKDIIQVVMELLKRVENYPRKMAASKAGSNHVSQASDSTAIYGTEAPEPAACTPLPEGAAVYGADVPVLDRKGTEESNEDNVSGEVQVKAQQKVALARSAPLAGPLRQAFSDGVFDNSHRLWFGFHCEHTHLRDGRAEDHWESAGQLETWEEADGKLWPSHVVHAAMHNAEVIYKRHVPKSVPVSVFLPLCIYSMEFYHSSVWAWYDAREETWRTMESVPQQLEEAAHRLRSNTGGWVPVAIPSELAPHVKERSESMWLITPAAPYESVCGITRFDISNIQVVRYENVQRGNPMLSPLYDSAWWGVSPETAHPPPPGILEYIWSRPWREPLRAGTLVQVNDPSNPTYHGMEGEIITEKRHRLPRPAGRASGAKDAYASYALPKPEADRPLKTSSIGPAGRVYTVHFGDELPAAAFVAEKLAEVFPSGEKVGDWQCGPLNTYLATCIREKKIDGDGNLQPHPHLQRMAYGEEPAAQQPPPAADAPVGSGLDSLFVEVVELCEAEADGLEPPSKGLLALIDEFLARCPPAADVVRAKLGPDHRDTSLAADYHDALSLQVLELSAAGGLTERYLLSLSGYPMLVGLIDDAPQGAHDSKQVFYEKGRRDTDEFSGRKGKRKRKRKNDIPFAFTFRWLSKVSRAVHQTSSHPAEHINHAFRRTHERGTLHGTAAVTVKETCPHEKLRGQYVQLPTSPIRFYNEENGVYLQKEPLGWRVCVSDPSVSLPLNTPTPEAIGVDTQHIKLNLTPSAIHVKPSCPHAHLHGSYHHIPGFPTRYFNGDIGYCLQSASKQLKQPDEQWVAVQVHESEASELSEEQVSVEISGEDVDDSPYAVMVLDSCPLAEARGGFIVEQGSRAYVKTGSGGQQLARVSPEVWVARDKNGAQLGLVNAREVVENPIFIPSTLEILPSFPYSGLRGSYQQLPGLPVAFYSAENGVKLQKVNGHWLAESTLRKTGTRTLATSSLFLPDDHIQSEWCCLPTKAVLTTAKAAERALAKAPAAPPGLKACFRLAHSRLTKDYDANSVVVYPGIASCCSASACRTCCGADQAADDVPVTVRIESFGSLKDITTFSRFARVSEFCCPPGSSFRVVASTRRDGPAAGLQSISSVEAARMLVRARLMMLPPESWAERVVFGVLRALDGDGVVNLALKHRHEGKTNDMWQFRVTTLEDDTAVSASSFQWTNVPCVCHPILNESFGGLEDSGELRSTRAGSAERAFCRRMVAGLPKTAKAPAKANPSSSCHSPYLRAGPSVRDEWDKNDEEDGDDSYASMIDALLLCTDRAVFGSTATARIFFRKRYGGTGLAIKARGAQLLSELIALNLPVTALHLDHNELGKEGAKALLYGLRRNRHLTEVRIVTEEDEGFPEDINEAIHIRTKKHLSPARIMDHIMCQSPQIVGMALWDVSLWDSSLSTLCQRSGNHARELVSAWLDAHVGDDPRLKALAVAVPRDRNHCTFLHVAASASWHDVDRADTAVTTLAMLIDDINMQDYFGLTPLHYAAMNTSDGAITVVNALLKRDASPGMIDNALCTPMHHAAKLGLPAVLARLITSLDKHPSLLASLDSINHFGDSVIMSASTNPRFNSEEGLRVLSSLHKKGLSLDSRDTDGRTALHQAARSGNGAILLHLLCLGANSSVLDDNSDNILDAAISCGKFDTEEGALVIASLTKKSGLVVSQRNADKKLSTASAARVD